MLGIHSVLFFLAMGFLIHRKTGRQKVLLIYTVVFFLFGTTQLVLSLVKTATVVRVLLQPGNEFNHPDAISDGLGNTQFAIFWTNNFVSDSLLFYRCYLIWGSRWRPMVLPGFLIAGTFIGAVTTLNVSVLLPFVFAALTNLVLVLFTAGRIWSARRDALHIFEGKSVRNRYNTAVAMTLESGVIYFIVTVVLVATTEQHLFNQAILGIAIHLINIVPTLIVVRVGLGHYIQDTGIQGHIPHSLEERPANRRPGALPQSPRGAVLYMKSVV
ncbi:hypothetical protein C8R46DRAFT_481996 [Mycena filopes]|nr:hypothetical protein C8R46DRAFT_481996 [Mycena filopes]